MSFLTSKSFLSLFQQNGVAGTDAKFYPSSESEGSDSDEDDKANTTKGYMMDPDHRLLLQSCQSLLQSRNSAVCFVLF